MAVSQYTPLQIAYTIVRIGKRLEDVSFEELNDVWLTHYACDRRYRLFWCAAVGGHAIFRIGKKRVLIEQRIDGCVFARWIQSDIFREKTCWKVTPTGDASRPYVSEWQEVVKI
jgi:hypothetical protein